MVAVSTIGVDLPQGVLKIILARQNDFYADFYDDADKTVASDLSGASVTLEVTPNDGTSVLIWTASIASNRATWTLSDTDTDVSWNGGTFQLILTKSAKPYAVLAGEVRTQS